jgi:hypothetical protein
LSGPTALGLVAGTVRNMRRLWIPALVLLALVPVLTTSGAREVDLPTTADRVAAALNRELTSELIDAVTSNEEGVALIEGIVQRAAADGPTDLHISVDPALGGLLVDLSTTNAARCVYLDPATLAAPPGQYAASEGGCDPEAYIAALEALVAASE